jgi:hypothetical protein
MNFLWASPAEETPSSETSLLESSRTFISNRLNGLANNIDSFFATERADDEFGRSRLRISNIYTIRDREMADNEIKYRLNLKLPHLSEKFKFKTNQEKSTAIKNENSSINPDQLLNTNAIQTKWIFNADAGISLAIPPRLVMRARLRKNIVGNYFTHRFSEEITYITDERGLVENTLLQSDFRLSDTFLFRFINSKTWKITDKDFFTKHGPTFIQKLTDNDAFSYNFITTNEMLKGVYFTAAHTFSIAYRRNLFKNWAYLDVIPGIDFPKKWSFRRTPFAIFQIEVLFGG